MRFFWKRLLSALLLASFTLTTLAWPMSRPRNLQNVELEMRQIPQSHCLRFRKFDMIRRCRRYRIPRHR